MNLARNGILAAPLAAAGPDVRAPDPGIGALGTLVLLMGNCVLLAELLGRHGIGGCLQVHTYYHRGINI